MLDPLRISYGVRALNPMRWFTYGESFLDAARVVEVRHSEAQKYLPNVNFENHTELRSVVIAFDTFKPALLLRAYASELMLKAFLIAKRQPYQPQNFGHKLLRLADYLFLDLTDAECHMLQLFEREIIWAGRYPKPKHESDFSFLLEDMPSNARLSLIESSDNFSERLRMLIEPELDITVLL